MPAINNNKTCAGCRAMLPPFGECGLGHPQIPPKHRGDAPRPNGKCPKPRTKAQLHDKIRIIEKLTEIMLDA